MAEENDPPETEPEDVAAPVSPAAVAVALGRAGHANEALDAEAGRFLREQTRMLGLQMEHLHEQRALNIKHFQWRLFGDRVKGALQALSLVAGAAIVLGIAALVWSAHEDRGLVIEAFSAPPDLAQKGLTGQVMATLVLDRIDDLDAKAQSERAANSYQDNWRGDIKVEIPTTGVSLGELDRLLRSTLGQETHISGNVFRSPAGLSVAVRAGVQPGVTATGSDADLDSLLGRAAEAIYATTQPYRYSKYLEGQGRLPEALAVARALSLKGATSERAWAYAQISNLLEKQGDAAGGVVAAKRALALTPTLALGASNAEAGEQLQGHDEAALRDYRLDLALLERAGSDIAPEARASLPLIHTAAVDDLLGDYAAAAAHFAEVAHKPEFQGLVALTPAVRANVLAKAHDASDAPDIDAAFAAKFNQTNDAIIPRYHALAEAGDWTGALADLDGVIAATQAFGALGDLERQRFLEPRRAFVLAHLGRQTEAEALIAAAPLDCYLCLRMRGKIAAAKSDWAGAARWFGEARRQGPSLPFADTDWGEMLLAKGDLAGAIAHLSAAHDISPHFADPLELWGETLLRQGDVDGALGRLREAEHYAPSWTRPHIMQAKAATARHSRGLSP